MSFVVEIYSLSLSKSVYYEVPEQLFSSLPSQNKINGLSEVFQDAMISLVALGRITFESESSKRHMKCKTFLNQQFLVNHPEHTLLKRQRKEGDAKAIEYHLTFKTGKNRILNPESLPAECKKKILFSAKAKWLNDCEEWDFAW